MFRIKIALVIGGLMMAFVGVQEWRLTQVAKAEPQAISCADLSAKGPGDNAHVKLTDFLMCEQSFVYEGKKNNPKWNNIWVPAVPVGGEYHRKVMEQVTPEGKLKGPPPIPTDIKVIVKSGKVPSEAELTQLAAQPTLDGLVTNNVETLGSKERKILEDSYPGTDFSKCWIIDHERKPAGMGQVAGLSGGGVLLTLLGLGWFLAGRRAPAAAPPAQI